MLERQILWFIGFYFLGIIFYKYFPVSINFLPVIIILSVKNKLFWKRISINLLDFIQKSIWFFIIGISIGFWQQDQLDKACLALQKLSLRPPAQINLKICSDVASDDRQVSFYVKYKKYILKTSLKRSAEFNFEYGDILDIAEPIFVSLQPPSNFGLTNYDEYLKLHKVTGKVYFKPENILVYQKPVFSFLRQIYRIKNKMVAVNDKLLPAPYDQTMGSIIFGSTAAPLSPEVQLAYKRAGLVHLLVVSGSQIAILIGVCLSLVKFAGFPGPLTFLLTSLFTVSFTLATGAGASIVRACIMAEFGLLGGLLGRQKDFYMALGCSALFMSFFNPYIILDIGFQLSYAATLALFYLAPILQNYFKQKIPEKISLALGVSLAPLLFTAPLAAFYFNGLSLISLPLNLIILPWVEVLVVSGFTAVVLGAVFLPLGQIINIFNYLLLFVLDKMVGIANKLPLAYVSIKQFNVLVLVLIYAAIFLGAEYLKTKNIKIKKYLTWIVIFLIIYFWFLNQDRTFKIRMFDVGQGDSILIKTPWQKTVLIDCGSENINDPGGNIVLPSLIKMGINRLNYLIITHPHWDHYSGLPGLIGKIKIDNIILEQPGSGKDDAYLALYHTAVNNKIKIIDSSDVPECISLEQAKIINLSADHTAQDPNDRSLAFLIEYKNFRFFTAGDLGAAGEGAALEQLITPDIDVLKVSHHGSKTATAQDFLSLARPEIALISVARKNKYHHPQQATLQKLANLSKIYRTDEQGAVEIEVRDNGQYKLKTSKRKFY